MLDMKQEKALNLRMSNELHETLKRLAEREGRSLNSYIIWVLRKEAEKETRQ